ncbi:MAG: thiolase [Rhodospirillaceae bacterium]|nr:thiolase [Rhodospirillaceae bacterium]|tara:strand:+ start:2545 stop:3738 length:1194 start_codon:yes stop_codon:yes gene_type:complete
MTNVTIAGTGMVQFGKFPNRTMKSMVNSVVVEALNDSNCLPDDIDQVFFGNAASGFLTGQECIQGQVALRNTGLLGKPIINIENACASSSTAFNLATMAIESGQSDAVLVIGAEKMTSNDKEAPLRALETAADIEELEHFKKIISSEGAGSGSIFMDLYASLARDYMEKKGVTNDDLALVAVKQRKAGALNKLAQFQEDISISNVLTSRMISDPLRLMMCSSIGDGAAALVLMSKDFAKYKDNEYVSVKACSLKSSNDKATGFIPAPTRAASDAYEKSGIGPEDIDVAEIHDAAAPAEYIIYEQLDFCKEGQAVQLLKSGYTSLDGKMPVNPSGGLISRGHPIGATGAAQLVELSNQLRNRSGKRQRKNAKIGLAENAGGWIRNDVAAACVTILGKD